MESLKACCLIVKASNISQKYSTVVNEATQVLSGLRGSKFPPPVYPLHKVILQRLPKLADG